MSVWWYVSQWCGETEWAANEWASEWEPGYLMKRLRSICSSFSCLAVFSTLSSSRCRAEILACAQIKHGLSLFMYPPPPHPPTLSVHWAEILACAQTRHGVSSFIYTPPPPICNAELGLYIKHRVLLYMHTPPPFISTPHYLFCVPTALGQDVGLNIKWEHIHASPPPTLPNICSAEILACTCKLRAL